MDETQNKNSDIIIPENQEENKVNDANIFKELSWELDFWKEEVEVPTQKVKDKEYYLKLWVSILWIVNIVLFLFFILSFWYVKIQTNNSYYSKTFLDPFCFIILWDLSEKNTWDYCSSISSLIVDYDTKTTKLKDDIWEKLASVVFDLYSIENFMQTKEVAFLMNNKVDRLKVLDILNDFDKLKNDFSAWDKKLVQCEDMKISDDGNVEMSCEIFSSSWDRVDPTTWWWIVWDSWDRNTSLIEWTSISTSASFLNFIEKNPEYNFQLLDKQKTFDSQVIWDGQYVKKTQVELKLKYNNLKNNLSL